MAGNNDIIDKSKLTQRELLLSLSEQMDSVNKKLDKLEPEYYAIRERVSNIESRSVVIASAISLMGVIAGLLFNLKKIIS